ncbi:MAG: YbaN family protein [Candidatus Ornithomonoglobus sp.]
MNYVFIALGFICIAISAVGVVFPILPTTPFLLLASLCFAKGSKRFHDWFKSTKLYKNHLESFEKNRSMTAKTKLCILIPVSALLIIAFFMMNNIAGRITLVSLIAIKYYYFIFRIKTIPADSGPKI